MTAEVAVDIFRHTMLVAFELCLPLLIIGLVVGIIVGLVQVAVSMQDPTFNAVPKLAAFLFGLLLLLPWMTAKLMSFTTGLFQDFGRYAR